LLKKEVIFREDLEKIFGKRPFDDHDHVLFNENGDTKDMNTTEAIAEVPVTEVSNEKPAGPSGTSDPTIAP